MLQALLLGVGLLLAVMALTRWFAAAPPAAVLRSVKWGAVSLLGGLGLVLLLSGRGAVLLGMALALAPLLGRRRLARLWGGLGRSLGSGSPGRSSQVVTPLLRMTLDHDSGDLDGEVLAGPFQGRRLSSLSLEEFAALIGAADEESLRLLEAWADRRYPDWREEMQKKAEEQNKATPPPQTAVMTEDEALRILGLQQGASREQIKEAHRRLMVKLHPDHGGSAYLAAQINMAKDILLGRS